MGKEMTITLEDAKTMLVTLVSLLTASATFFLWLTKIVVTQAISNADKEIHEKIEDLRRYVDHTFVQHGEIDQLSKRVDDLRG